LRTIRWRTPLVGTQPLTLLAQDLPNNSLSTNRRLTGIVMNDHPVFAWCWEIPQGLGGQPIEIHT
jgi:hypothetical protein